MDTALIYDGRRPHHHHLLEKDDMLQISSQVVMSRWLECFFCVHLSASCFANGLDILLSLRINVACDGLDKRSGQDLDGLDLVFTV